MPSRSSRATANREIKVIAKADSQALLDRAIRSQRQHLGCARLGRAQAQVGEQALGCQPGARALLAQQPRGPGQVGRNLPAHDDQLVADERVAGQALPAGRPPMPMSARRDSSRSNTVARLPTSSRMLMPGWSCR